eukprot:CAMPEP_0202956692 /NCGR_PEP_ID=MMETSP1396-20130829/1194_1 /ASSEMBLY_ACC=CAM_ASM_000872 /TAXON_ID= /ORGANISM="Pseudokeronopsis sp., Strain Brazil" /LENGTH=146 /DNA_ID=CAMNT_0049673825 /DNA_START=103 /DNA_END=543 /DNA_ORIENTATION=-
MERFHSEQYQARRDFEQLLNSTDEKERAAMLEKYELFIEANFEPYAAMHECRPHSNLWGKHLNYPAEALASDPIGYYKPKTLYESATDVHFHEEYPHMVTAWVYDEKFLNDDFNYEDMEAKYLAQEQMNKVEPQDTKRKIDAVHGK